MLFGGSSLGSAFHWQPVHSTEKIPFGSSHSPKFREFPCLAREIMGSTMPIPHQSNHSGNEGSCNLQRVDVRASIWAAPSRSKRPGSSIVIIISNCLFILNCSLSVDCSKFGTLQQLLLLQAINYGF